MPLIMEDGIDVDDLFGDPTSLELGLSSAPATKGLAQRLDEMRRLGCCQYVPSPCGRALLTDPVVGRSPGRGWDASHTSPRTA